MSNQSDRERKDRDRDRDREREKERSRDKDGDRNNQSEGGIKGSTNSNGEIELDFEATNKLRISLGLKPLNNAESGKEKSKEQKDAEEAKNKERKTLELQVKLDKAKEEREYKKRIQGKSIAEQDDDDDDAAAWVRRSRTITQQKELALKRQQEMDELEDNQESKKYSTSDLKGIKVSHDLNSLDEPLILTLKDTSVLKESDVNDDDDELENIKLIESEKLKKNKELKKKKPIYNVYDTENKSLLSQYDEPKEKEKFVIAADGQLVNSLNEQDSIKQKLKETEISLDLKKSLATEYYTETEMLKFKKGNKKKKTIRKKKSQNENEDENAMSVDTDNTAPETSSNHGSRRESQKTKNDMKIEMENKERRDKNYSRALEKASDSSKLVFEDEKGDEDFLNSLEKNRGTKSSTLKDSKSIAQLVLERAKKKEEEELYGKSKMSDANEKVNPSTVFTSTTEFIGRIQPIDEILGEKKKSKKDKKNSNSMVIDTTDIDQHEKMLQEQREKQRKQNELEREKEKEKQESEEVTIKPKKEKEGKNKRLREPMDTDTNDGSSGSTDHHNNNGNNDSDDESNSLKGVLEEPLVATGLAATLQMLKSKGTTSTINELETWKGRKNDKTLEEEYVRVPGFLRGDTTKRDVRLEYLDANGNQLTPREAFRELSHRFHGKMPGKNKQEKRMRQHEEEQKRKRSSSTDTPLNTVKSMRTELEKAHTPFILLSGAGTGNQSSDHGGYTGNEEVNDLNIRKKARNKN